MILRDLMKTIHPSALLYILKDDGEGNYTGNYGHGSKYGWETRAEFNAHGCAKEWLNLPVIDYATVKMFWENMDYDDGVMIWLGVQNGKGER